MFTTPAKCLTNYKVYHVKSQKMSPDNPYDIGEYHLSPEVLQHRSSTPFIDIYDFNKTLQRKEVNCVLEHLGSVDGIPLSAFLNRVSLVSKLPERKRPSIEWLIDDSVERLACDSVYNRKINYIEKVEPIHTLCQIATTEELMPNLTTWLKTNSERLNDALASCLFLECQELAQECCFAVAYLARKLHFKMRTGVESIVDALIRLLSEALMPKEKYVTAFKEARQLHAEGEKSNKQMTVFHPLPLIYNYFEVYHRLIGVIYYTLADLLFNIPSPELIRLFVSRIFRRREIARYMLFQILDSVVTNMGEIQDEAERMVRSMNNMKERQSLFDENIWRILPSVLYIDILRAYSEVNIACRDYPDIVLNMLRAQATMKYPLMDEKTLQTVQDYWKQSGFFDFPMDRLPCLSLKLSFVERAVMKLSDLKTESCNGSITFTYRNTKESA